MKFLLLLFIMTRTTTASPAMTPPHLPTNNNSRCQSHISPPPRAWPSAAAAPAHRDAAQVQVDAQAELKALEKVRDKSQQYYEVELDKKRATLTSDGIAEAQREAKIGS
jgi:hypothetical protein